MKSYLLTAFLLAINHLHATEFLIGPEMMLTSPNEFYTAMQSGSVSVADGDTISIVGGTYRGIATLAIWEQNNLLIRGIDGRADLYADGEYIIGKGIFVSKGNNITYENIGFFDASVPDQNGAGIRLDGAGLVVRNCYFFNNENGILANDSDNGEVLIEYSEFASGGFGDGFSHNIYINHCASLTIQYCYFHDASVGHHIKSRANQNYILYNRVADLDGNSSRLIDIPNGGQCIILGNELIQGVNAENNNLIGFGLEGLSNPKPHTLKFAFNTVLNYRNGSCVFFHAREGTDTLLVINNILGGVCNLFQEKEVEQAGNLISESIEEIKFINTDSFHLNLFASSGAIDLAVNVADPKLQPHYEYVHPLNGKIREVITTYDSGAHEADIIIPTSEIQGQTLTYNNPVNKYINLTSGNGQKYILQSLSGSVMQAGIIADNVIDVASLPAGIYILSIEKYEPIKVMKL